MIFRLRDSRKQNADSPREAVRSHGPQGVGRGPDVSSRDREILLDRAAAGQRLFGEGTVCVKDEFDRLLEVLPSFSQSGTLSVGSREFFYEGGVALGYLDINCGPRRHRWMIPRSAGSNSDAQLITKLHW